MRNIEFVSYDGKYPNLCSGTLTLCVDGNLWSESMCLFPGGECLWDSAAEEEIVDQGPWESLTLEKHFSDEEVREILRLVNEHVEWGCCGGCM